jgi:hypothetical protein
MQNFGFKTFNGEFGKDLGFEGSLKFLGERDGFQEYLVPTPLVRNLGGDCPQCEGTGKHEVFEDEKCLSSLGEGKTAVFNYREAYPISASLTVLFDFMRFPEMETSCKLPQLMRFQTVTAAEIQGGNLDGEFSREAVRWMKLVGTGEIDEMVKAMVAVWKKMEGGMKFYDLHSFRAYLSNDQAWLCTDMPGDSCGIHPESSAGLCTSRGEGYEFFSHNSDTPMQQFVVLASLAALNDLIRQDFKPH